MQPSDTIVIQQVTNRPQFKNLLKEVITEVWAEMKPATEPDLNQRMNIEEAAAFCRVSKGTFRQWIKSGFVPAHGPGKIKFFLRNELIESLNSKKP